MNRRNLIKALGALGLVGPNLEAKTGGRERIGHNEALFISIDEEFGDVYCEEMAEKIFGINVHRQSREEAPNEPYTYRIIHFEGEETILVLDGVNGTIFKTKDVVYDMQVPRTDVHVFGKLEKIEKMIIDPPKFRVKMGLQSLSQKEWEKYRKILTLL